MSATVRGRDRIEIEADNRWDAVRILGEFRDRGSFLIARRGIFDVYVRSDEPEVVERLEHLKPFLDAEVTARVLESS